MHRRAEPPICRELVRETGFAVTQGLIFETEVFPIQSNRRYRLIVGAASPTGRLESPAILGIRAMFYTDAGWKKEAEWIKGEDDEVTDEAADVTFGTTNGEDGLYGVFQIAYATVGGRGTAVVQERSD